jgi:Protein of unknown function (DUF1597).
MKFNKWTLGLAAVGVVSLASAVRADEAATANTVLTSLSSTTISGYVDTSAQWNLGPGNANPPPVKFNNGKQDGFNLDVVQITIAKPLDESEWAAGYRFDGWFGPDANSLNTASLNGGSQTFYPNRDFAIRQAYVALRTPIGNGLDWKIGVFDSIIGYESVASPSNPNYTRSYGHSIEPQTITGLLATYRFNDHVSIAGGIGNTIGPTINGRAFNNNFDTDPGHAESFKAYMGSIALTAPDSWGFMSGSSLYGGIVTGLNDVDNAPGGIGATDWETSSTSYYAGATMSTPINNLKLGVAFDDLEIHNVSGETWCIGAYASFQATEKLSLHVRGEYLRDRGDQQALSTADKIVEITTTIQYDLWKNVLSRVEFRWDHAADGSNAFGGVGTAGPTLSNAYMLAANIIYKF